MVYERMVRKYMYCHRDECHQRLYDDEMSIWVEQSPTGSTAMFFCSRDCLEKYLSDLRELKKRL